MDRRDFLKNSIKVGMLLGINSSFALATTYQSSINHMGKVPSYSNCSWKRTIFCQFDNKYLKEVIETCAKEMDCNVYHGEVGSPDIVAIPYFVAVVDLNTIGDDIWEDYVEYCDEVEDNTPLIICGVFEPCAFKLPNLKYRETFHIFDPYEITKSIKEIKEHVDKTC